MKFLKSEHKDISEILKKKGFDESQYSFRKKRGLLFIEIVDRTDSFCFYRKTSSELNSAMQFEESTSYFIGQKKDLELDTWNEVLTLIEKWA